MSEFKNCSIKAVFVSPKHLSQRTLQMLRAEQLVPGAGVAYSVPKSICAGTHRDVPDNPLLKLDPEALIPDNAVMSGERLLADTDLPAEERWIIEHPGLVCVSRDGYLGTPDDILELLIFMECHGFDWAVVSSHCGERFDDDLDVFENDAYCDISYALDHPEIFELVANSAKEIELDLERKRIQRN